MASQRKIPITLLTGFTGSGKTTILLNTLPQIRSSQPNYKLCLIKNEIGDVAVDSALAAAAELTGSRELLGDCICCTNVGQIGDALETLDVECQPDRIVIETSGSAEPLKLVLEVNRLSRESGGKWELDGVISVIDAENWGGYASTSYTAKLQAQQTDLIVVNKWEGLGEREMDLFLDRLGDLDVQTPVVRSVQGKVGVEVLFGVDPTMSGLVAAEGHGHDHGPGGHRAEVECISVTLRSEKEGDASVDLGRLDGLLRAATKDEVFRIKAILYSTQTPKSSDGSVVNGYREGRRRRHVLNWSFGRWSWSSDDTIDDKAAALRMSVFTAQDESNKWIKKIENGGFFAIEGEDVAKLEVKRVQ